MSEPATPAFRPTLSELFRAFVLVSISGFGGALPWARRTIVERKRWMTTEEFNEAFALSQFLPGPNVINFSVVFGSRFGGAAGAAVALAGLLGPPLIIVTVLAILYERYGDIETLSRILLGITAAATGLLIAVVAKMAAPLFLTRWNSAPVFAILAFAGVAFMQWPLPYVFLGLAPLSIGFRLVQAMNTSPLTALAGYFALLSLFAVGGANAAIPEMHRISVEVMHWMSDRQFADMFAIAQVSPGPNVIIVALIGYHVAGFAGAGVATTAMCGPTCVLAFFVSRVWDRFKEAHWRIAIQAGLVPLSLGLIGASAFVLARTRRSYGLCRLDHCRHRGGGVLHAHQSAVDLLGGRRAGFERRALSRPITECRCRRRSAPRRWRARTRSRSAAANPGTERAPDGAVGRCAGLDTTGSRRRRRPRSTRK